MEFDARPFAHARLFAYFFIFAFVLLNLSRHLLLQFAIVQPRRTLVSYKYTNGIVQQFIGQRAYDATLNANARSQSHCVDVSTGSRPFDLLVRAQHQYAPNTHVI